MILFGYPVLILQKSLNMNEKKVLGVCAWLGDRFDIDVSMLRIIFVITTIVGVGSPILIYLILALIKPSDY